MISQVARRRFWIEIAAGALGIGAAGCEGWRVAPGNVSLQEQDNGASVAAAVDLRSESTTGWPNLFGPTYDSISTETAVRTQWPDAGPPVVWRRDVGAGYSAPVCLNDCLILFHRQAHEEIVECLDARTGESLWRYAWTTHYDCPVEYSDGPYSTPALDQDRVYAWGAEGKLVCLNLATGEPVWQRSLNEEYRARPEGFFPVAGSPLAEGDRLILNVGGRETEAGIVAIDKHTGQTLWTVTADGASYATPRAVTIHGRRYVFVFTADGLVSLDPADGRVWWSIPFRAKNREVVNATSPLVHQDVVLVSGYQLGNLCVRVRPDGSYEELWRDKRRNLDSQYNNLLSHDGYVYGFSALDRSFRCLELETGEVCWKWLSDIGRGASIAAAGRILIWGEQGHLASLDLDSHEARPVCITRDSLVEGQLCFTAPALHRGMLYVRTEKTLLCLDLRK